MLAHMFAFRHSADQFLAHVTGMAGHVPDPFHPRDGVHLAEESGKGIFFSPVLAVGVHVLAQKGEFPVALVHGLLDFFTDGIGAPAPFPAPDIGDDAVGAEIVAAVHDGYPGGIAAFPDEMPLKFPGHYRQIVVHPCLPVVLLEIILQNGAEVVYMGRADKQVHLGILFQKVLPVFLGHAAGNAQDLGRIFPFDLLHLPDFPQDLLFRAFPDAAGVDEDHIRIVIVFRIMVPQVGQLPGIMFRITLVHLTAVIQNGVTFGHWFSVSLLYRVTNQ